MKHARHSAVTPYERAQRRIARRNRIFDGFDLTLVVAQTVSLFLVMFAAVPFALQLFTGVSTNIVLTGSMSGTAEPGDLIQTQPYLGQRLTEGTIVGVEQNGMRYTHRIVEVIVDDEGAVTYATKGDANDKRDLFTPSGDDIWGIASNVVHQPLATFLVRFAWNADWTEMFAAAVMAGDFEVMGALLPTAPWGLFGLLFVVIACWWVMPDVLGALRTRLNRRDNELAESIELDASGDNPEFVTRSPFERYRKTI